MIPAFQFHGYGRGELVELRTEDLRFTGSYRFIMDYLTGDWKSSSTLAAN